VLGRQPRGGRDTELLAQTLTQLVVGEERLGGVSPSLEHRIRSAVALSRNGADRTSRRAARSALASSVPPRPRHAAA
jgi:hypothetical protein